MGRLFKHIVPWWLLAVGLFAATIIVWQAARWTRDIELKTMVETGEERLTLYTGTLRGALSRYAYLPYVLAQNGTVLDLLDTGTSLNQVNHFLEDLNREAGSEALYVMNATGETLASSNWHDPFSFVGQNYSFRPYFTDAKAGRQGRFFAIGVTTGQPGFFMSHPIYSQGRFIGAAVVKVDLDPLQDDWREGGETVLVSDANGVLFLSSRNDWKYHSLTTLSTEQQTHIRSRRQYGEQPLKLVPLQTVEILSADHHIVRVDKLSYLMLSRTLPGLNWKLLYLAPLAPVHERILVVVAIGTASVLLVLAIGMYARERRQKKLSRRKAKEAEAIKEINLRLQEEIGEHCRTEQALRDTQAELVQNSKLAALGQMAAGIVHELNQPISAMRTYAASGRLLLERQETNQVLETFTSITRITDHMAKVTTQLKIFAHKAPKQCERVVLQSCISGALSMTDPLFSEVEVTLHKNLPDEPVELIGDHGRIEQVLVNLIRNGIDAMRGSTQRELRISIIMHRKMVEIVIADTGTGIEEQNLPELFNPFFTTKEVGEGLGLGLSITYRIVTDLGGSIRAMNNPGGGASFIVLLPLLAAESTGVQI